MHPYIIVYLSSLTEKVPGDEASTKIFVRILPFFPFQVHSWLEQLFQGEGGVPEYEINSQTIEQLYQMALRCQARERSAKVIIEDLEQKAEEYTAESKWGKFTIQDYKFGAGTPFVKTLD